MKPETMMIDDVKYVREDSISNKQTKKINRLTLSIVRSYGAGVFLGYIEDLKAELNGVNIKLLKAKRIFYWDGACSLTQLAMDGTSAPQNCKITDAIDFQFVANVIEVLPVTEKAKKSLDEVIPWKK